MDKKSKFDIVIIGGGSAGFSAAIKAAESGKQAVLINSGTIGGTCINIGCVPSKFLIHKAYSGNSWNTIKKERDRLVAKLRNEKYQNVLENYNKNITYFNDSANFINRDSVSLTDGRIITGKKYIVTTGSKPFFPKTPGLSDIVPLDSTGLLFIEDLPESLIIVGGRFIALELGQAFARLGVKVTILQRSNRLIPQYDSVISAGIEQIFKKQGIDVITRTTLLKALRTEKGKTLQYSVDAELREISADQIVFATGRTGNTETLNLSNAEVKTNISNHIITNKFLCTSNQIVFAAGDVLASPGLVYVAAKEGQTAAHNTLEKEPIALKYDIVPEVIFTHPQIARVGITKNEALTKNIPISSTNFFIADTPYGLANNDKNGVIKLIINTDSGLLIGGEIMARDAGNMIQVLTLAIKAQMSVEDLVDTYFPYLTAVEGIKLGSIVFNKDVKKLSCCAS